MSSSLGPLNRIARWAEQHVLVVVLVAVRGLLVVTYPLNLMLTDGRDYYDMLVEGRSSLIHAPGYPFLVGLPWRNPLGRLLMEHHPLVFERLLLVMQHGINLACLVLGARVVREVFGRLPAGLFVLFYGLHYHVLDVTSSCTPEWLQGSLLMVLAYLALRAVQAERPRRKLALWSLCGFVFAWTYLVKFNSITYGTLMAAAAVWQLRRSRRAWRALTAAAATSVATFGLFVALFHRPSTGSWAISYDHAWVMLERMGRFVPGKAPSLEAGIATRRMVVLNSLLPRRDDLGPIAHVDWVPATERAPYQDRYGYLLAADDSVLRPLLERVKIPRPYDFKTAFLPVAYYLGPAEADRLGVAVFFEHVRTFPKAYFDSVWQLTLRALTRPKPPWTYPLTLPPGVCRSLGWGFVELPTDVDPEVGWRYSRPVVWAPGVSFFSLHYELLQIPKVWFTILLAGACAAACARARRHRRLDLSSGAYLVGAATVAGSVIFSSLIFYFRWKEVQAVLPLVVALVSAAVFWLARWTVSRFADEVGLPRGTDQM